MPCRSKERRILQYVVACFKEKKKNLISGEWGKDLANV